MSQLVVQPGRNAARQAKKLKEIRKVKAAIVWHERQRKKRQEFFQERWESRQAILRRIQWENENVKQVKKKALSNVKEDWRLGSLRPNRAIGKDAQKYGALTTQQAQKPDIPLHTQRNRNEARLKRGLDPECPLVVEDAKYFHIVPQDRVVVVNGPEKGKMGVVQDVVSRTHEVIVKGINMQNYDSDVFMNTGQGLGSKRASEVPLPIDDVRLVTAYEFKSKECRRGQQVLVAKTQDVIVDKVLMERHTTGVDPFTGTNYGAAEIPKDHQYDPMTGLPIFHRYIAGTRQRIEWPWEKDEAVEDAGVTQEEAADKQTLLRRTLDTLRHPIMSIQRARAKKATEKANIIELDKDLKERAIRQYKKDLEAKQLRNPAKPKSNDPGHVDAYDGTDTTRNIVEGSEPMAYTLITPPFPDTLAEELRADIHNLSAEARKTKDDAEPRAARAKRVTEYGAAASREAKARHAAARRMKSPMQLRWELELARKVKQQKSAPLVSTDELMAALGRHIHAQKTQSVKVSEVD